MGVKVSSRREVSGFLNWMVIALRTIPLLHILILLVVVSPRSVIFGQVSQIKKERFAAGRVVVPPGYRAERVVGPDFDVDYVIREGAQVNQTDVMLGIYTGSFPGFSPPAKGVKSEAGHFGGKRFKWHIWKTTVGGKTTFHREGLVRREGGQWVWHIFVAAPDKQRMKELMRILRSYRAQ